MESRRAEMAKRDLLKVRGLRLAPLVFVSQQSNIRSRYLVRLVRREPLFTGLRDMHAAGCRTYIDTEKRFPQPVRVS